MDAGLTWLAIVLILAGLLLAIADSPAGSTALGMWSAGATTALVVGLTFPLAGPEAAWASAFHSGTAAFAILLAGWLIVGEVQEMLLRGRLTRLAIDVAGTSTPGPFVDAFRSALGDPALEVQYWVTERASFVDGDGRRVVPPSAEDSRQTTRVARAGRLLAVLVHTHPVDAGTVTRALGPAARLALENDQLRAAQLAELREVDESRRRILDRAREERRRLERNLHDGAQQRVVSLVLLLRMLAGRVDPKDAEAVAGAASAAANLLEGLRSVARGIHPALVMDAGLAGALIDLAETSTDVPVTVRASGVMPLSAIGESTAYEFVSTVLADARALGASSVDVRSRSSGCCLAIDVDHDATGVPDTDDLDGLAVQAEALSGDLHVDGRPGCWHLTLELPCES
jgi:signal transduction histidine kinase